MIDLYTWTTPNGRKVSILLEELGLKYKVIAVNLPKSQQAEAAFTALNPNQKIPAIVDHGGPGGALTVIESGAILIYLAEKTGRFLPAHGAARSETIQWLMFQMASVGPMLGQANYFANTASEKIPFAIQRFLNESIRIVGVLNTRLAGRDFLADDYSIADMATYPWISAAWPLFKNLFPEQVGSYGNVQRWLDTVGARPAVQAGMLIPAV